MAIEVKVPDGYKATVIGIIPNDWQIKSISDLFDVKNGATPSTKEAKYWSNEQINWITPTDLNKLTGKSLISRSSRMISEIALSECNLTLMPTNSLIMSTRAPVGYVTLVKEKATFNQGCKGLIPINKSVFPHFYMYFLLKSKEKLKSISGGSTFQELSKKSLNNFQVPLPHLPEQQKIASILSKVDEHISQTKAIIEKTEELKNGLMQQLFTKGIGHTEFKETELGEIPDEWEVCKLGDILTLQRGHDLPLSDRIKGNIPVIGSNGIVGYHNEAKYKGTCVSMGRSGTIGKIHYYEGDYWPLNTSLFVKNFNDNAPIFLYYLLQGINYEKFNSGTSVPTLNRNLLHPHKVPFTFDINEQKKIASILSKVDSQIKQNKNYLSNLEELKKGLMQDLLTGKVRVNV
ncbi:MAG: restriction endonuclease subunit S [Methanococcoides sp.]|nr:restriction endonuclease subunit S [Methanococcoides sp.]